MAAVPATRCRNVVYCSTQCQRIHWAEHKHLCRKSKGGKPAQSDTLTIVSDVASWKFSEEKLPLWETAAFDDSQWKTPVKVGTLGGGPWNIPGLRSASPVSKLNSEDIFAPEGFIVEPVYTVPKEQGSWVSMATDPQGRIYASDQGGAGLYRMTVRKDASPIVEKVSVNSLEIFKLFGWGD